MGNPYIMLLSAIVFLPALGAIVLMFFPKGKDDAMRYFTLLVTAVVFALTVLVFLVPGFGGEFDYRSEAAAYMQYVFNVPWIPSFDIDYFMGVDGISFPLIMLTSLICLLAMGASWSVTKYVKGYCILFLLLETGMLGVFLALDFFLFYVFWEVMLLPMYFLIGVWGGPRREYAAIKFFLYTLLGSVLMLVAILLLYFNSDLRELAKVSDKYAGGSVAWQHLHIPKSIEAKIETELNKIRHLDWQPAAPDVKIQVEALGAGEPASATLDADSKTVMLRVPAGASLAQVQAAIEADSDVAGASKLEVRFGVDAAPEGWTRIATDDRASNPVHTFNLLALSALGQHTEAFSPRLQWWAFLLLFVGFAIKVPSVPVHTWLPDAHVEAPTPISMILAGILLKMGGYGIIRICYPICPHGGYDLALFVCLIGVISMVYGAFAAMAQKDFKRLVAYSSVSHMGYVVLGLGVWSATAGTLYNPEYWQMGVAGAMFQMIAHGISSAGMFFLVGVVYDRVHHRNLDEFGGLFAKMPVYTALSIGIFFAALGLPGLCGFIGEVLVVLSVWNYSYVLAIIAASVVILTAGYILWTIQRVYLGPEYKGPHGEALVPSTMRENTIAAVLFTLAILFGVFPQTFLLRYMDKTIDRQVHDLAAWTQQVKDAGAETAPPAAAATVEAEWSADPPRDHPVSLQTLASPGTRDVLLARSDDPLADDPEASVTAISHGAREEHRVP